MKRKIIFIALTLVILSGCSQKTDNQNNQEKQAVQDSKEPVPADTDKNTNHAGQTGILIQTANVTYFDPNNYKKRTVMVKEGNLVLVINENKDDYHIQLAATELPVLAGHVSKDAVSFDDADIQNATSGLAKNVSVYESPKDKKPKTTGYSSAVLIEGKEGDFFKCSLPGGDEGYIKKDDIEFIVEKAEWTVEMLPPEQ
ncbi:MAG: membrane lipoprotein lipid attachment site-containing protein [Lachnospiraceae bacterium]|nr:membrane lipoprotein lipid attachment site-containing protein [Lachnospiraceae bacterium]